MTGPPAPTLAAAQAPTSHEASRTGGTWHGYDHDREDPGPGSRQGVGRSGRSHHGEARPLSRQRRHLRGGHRRVRKGRFRARVRPGEDRAHPRPFHARTRTSSPPGWSSRCASSPRSTVSCTGTTWAVWASSMPSCPSRAWWDRVTSSWVPTPTPARMAPWARSPPESAPPTWPAPWPPAKPGSGCLRPTGSTSTGPWAAT